MEKEQSRQQQFVQVKEDSHMLEKFSGIMWAASIRMKDITKKKSIRMKEESQLEVG